MRKKTNETIFLALLSAIVFIGTYINIKIPIGGGTSMIHLGTTAIFISAILVGKDAFFPAAIGCALFDIVTFPMWAIPTFIVKGLTGYVAGKIAFSHGKNGNSVKYNILGFILGSIVSLIGYFLFNWLLFIGWDAAILSLSTSIITSLIGIIIAIPISMGVNVSLKKYKKSN